MTSYEHLIGWSLGAEKKEKKEEKNQSDLLSSRRVFDTRS